MGQTQVNNRVGLSFEKGLRAILRQDPDVVMVGEIRDKETADIAIQASLTGHLVLSTVHTNDSVGAITRLIDMGVEPYLIASSLRMVIAQRLVRKLDQTSNELAGRIGVFESITIDDEIKEQIHKNSTENDIKKIAFKENNTLELDGQEKVNSGMTTEAELRSCLLYTSPSPRDS